MPNNSRRAALVEALCVTLVLLCGFALRLRIGQGWTYAGSDSFAYLGGASELAENHRYAFRLPAWYPDHAVEQPLGYCRVPGYSLFLATVAYRFPWLSRAPASPPAKQPPTPAYETLFSRIKPAQAALDLLTCLLVFLMARKLRGPRAAWPALLLAAAYPPLLFFAAAILTETLATALTTAALALLTGALLLPPRPARYAWIAAGAVVALGGLVRVDGLFLVAALPAPLLVRLSPKTPRPGGPRRPGLPTFALALLAFLVCFLPWPARNYLRFGAAHPLGGQCDTRGRAVQHTAFYGWFATWLERESQTPETLYCLLRPECVSSVATFPPEAFASPAERTEVQRLFTLRQREGLSERVDQGFRALTLARVRARPAHTLVWLPLVRAYHLWVSAQDQPLRSTMTLPWQQVMGPVRRALAALNVGLWALGLLGLGLVLADRALRPVGWLALVVLGLRTGLISLIGFVDNRYVLEVTPLMLVLAGVALARITSGSSPASPRRS